MSYKAREREKRRRRSRQRSRKSRSKEFLEAEVEILADEISSAGTSAAAAQVAASPLKARQSNKLQHTRSSSVFNFDVNAAQIDGAEPIDSAARPPVEISAKSNENLIDSAQALPNPPIQAVGNSQAIAQPVLTLPTVDAGAVSGSGSSGSSNLSSPSPTAFQASSPVTNSSSVSRLTVAIDDAATGEIVRLDGLDAPPISVSHTNPSQRFGGSQFANSSIMSSVPSSSAATPRSPSTRYRFLNNSSNPGTALNTPMDNSIKFQFPIGQANFNAPAPQLISSNSSDEAAAESTLPAQNAEFSISPNLINSLTNFSVSQLSQGALSMNQRSNHLLSTPSHASSKLSDGPSIPSSPFRFGRSLTVTSTLSSGLGAYSASTSSLPSPMQKRPSTTHINIPSVTLHNSQGSASGSMNPSALNSPVSLGSTAGFSSMGAKYYSFYKRQFSLQNESALEKATIPKEMNESNNEKEKSNEMNQNEEMPEILRSSSLNTTKKNYSASSRVHAHSSNEKLEGNQNSIELESNN